MKSIFFSKVLLFGEYSIIRNSMALSVPYPLFEGILRFKREGDSVPDVELKSFIQYLKQLQQKGKLSFPFDIASFEFDVGRGLFFDSSIPQGFGVGSSGALCAALYDRYGVPSQNNTEEITELKKKFALLESHFHGASSGIDPLISYLRHGLLLTEDRTLKKIIIPEYGHGDKGMFILDTGRARKTEPLVNLFLEKLKNKTFSNMVEKKLLPVNNACINHFLNQQTNELYSSFKELSILQSKHFSPMIPQLLQTIWQNGLASDHYYLKLCGAGGGGFFLGITHDFDHLQKTLSPYVIRPLCRFPSPSTGQR